MNWLHFFLWLIGLYSTYYILNIVFDIFFSKVIIDSADQTIQAISFDEEHITKKMEQKQKPPKMIPPASVALGGVTMEKIFLMSQAETIDLVRGVTF